MAPSRQLQRTHNYVTWPDVFLRRNRGRGLGAFVGRDGGNRTGGLAGWNRMDPAFGVTRASRAGLESGSPSVFGNLLHVGFEFGRHSFALSQTANDVNHGPKYQTPKKDRADKTD